MSVEAPIYNTIAAKLASLVGTQGAAGKVTAIRREHVPHTQNAALPYLVVEVVGDEFHDSFQSAHYKALVRIHVFAHRDRDRDQTSSDAIVDAVRDALKEQTLSASGDYTFSTPVRLRGFRGPSATQTIHRIEEYSIIATDTAGGDS